MPSRDAYWVGWICGLVPELVAAQACLDEKHEKDGFTVAPNDNNTYVRGRIGDHNVVIACIASGDYGTVSAATVARDMLHSFPNIRIGLFVGIGGGAPSDDDDIRLGDVVVNQNSGVRGFNSDEAIRNKRFSISKHLDTSPEFFRTAINTLQMKYETEGHEIESSIHQFLAKIKLRKKYERPAADTDKLYLSGKNELKERGERDAPDSVQIFYGNIASADTVIKDATIRDSFSASDQILCFETEAAGLMNHYPCLIIRGICDYADSHANKLWHGYAAMSAVAYAKELLLEVSVTDIEKQRTVDEALKTPSTTTVNSTTHVHEAAAVPSSQNAIQNTLTTPDRHFAPGNTKSQSLQKTILSSQGRVRDSSPGTELDSVLENATSQDQQCQNNAPPPPYSEHANQGNTGTADNKTSPNFNPIIQGWNQMTAGRSEDR